MVNRDKDEQPKVDFADQRTTSATIPIPHALSNTSGQSLLSLRLQATASEVHPSDGEQNVPHPTSAVGPQGSHQAHSLPRFQPPPNPFQAPQYSASAFNSLFIPSSLPPYSTFNPHAQQYIQHAYSQHVFPSRELPASYQYSSFDDHSRPTFPLHVRKSSFDHTVSRSGSLDGRQFNGNVLPPDSVLGTSLVSLRRLHEGMQLRTVIIG